MNEAQGKGEGRFHIMQPSVEETTPHPTPSLALDFFSPPGWSPKASLMWELMGQDSVQTAPAEDLTQMVWHIGKQGWGRRSRTVG